MALSDPKLSEVLTPKSRDDIPNHNKLLENKYLLTFTNLPGLSYFTQSIPIPAVSLNVVETDNPLNKINWPGTKLNYGQSLTVGFSVDEDLRNYLGILRWMEGLGFPDNTDQQKDLLKGSLYGSLFADARLLLANNSFNFKHEVVYRHCFPVDLGSIQFETTTQAASELICSVTFSYESFKIVPINSGLI